MIDIGGSRLVSQHVEGERFERPEDVVNWMGAMQAQDYRQALWAVGVRTIAATQADVERGLFERKIVRTWPMRGTLHFVAPKDAEWMVKLSAPRRLASARTRLKQLELDEPLLERCKVLFTEALAGGRQLTRPGMMEVLERAGIATTGQRGYSVLWYAAQTGLICFGAPEGKQQTFVLLREWVPHPRQLDRDESLAELARRYVGSHGPATVHDFAWWSGQTVTDARRAFQAAGLAENCGPKAKRAGQTAHLLPGFDEYFLGYKDRSAILDAEHADKVFPGANGIFKPIVVDEGRVVGIWHRRLGKKAVEVEIALFSENKHVPSRLRAAIARYGQFLELPVDEASYSVI